jgi:hypothetical protein
MLQCSGDARFDLQIKNIPHWQEDIIYGNGLFSEVQDCTYIVQVLAGSHPSWSTL